MKPRFVKLTEILTNLFAVYVNRYEEGEGEKLQVMLQFGSHSSLGCGGRSHIYNSLEYFTHFFIPL